MTHLSDHSVLAIDVGSTSAKLGWFPAPGECAARAATGDLPIAAPLLPEPAAFLRIEHARQPAGDWLASLDAWLDDLPDEAGAWCIMSAVHQRAADQLCDRLARRSGFGVRRLAAHDIPIELRINEPQRVGVDRLLGAMAVNRVRDPRRAAISVDMGTAITVNLIAADGAFEGGAILPGPGVALAALHAATTSLPLLAPPDLAEPFPPVGKTTDEAMRSGVFWGALGAIRELTARFALGSAEPPELFLTGGGAKHFTALLSCGDGPVRHVPHLVLSGIRLVADGLTRP
jgi:type III pantothenate kinase